MSPERWQRVNEVFQSALTREEAQRASFLDDACAEDLDLRREVDSLLTAHEHAGVFLSGSPIQQVTSGGTAGVLAAGARLGPYEIVSLLGTGGMGEVYRARDPRLRREVAIKVMARAPGADAQLRLRFEQEARAAGALNHPNVLAVYDVGEEAGVQYVVSELLLGETLRARLGRGALPWREALEWARQAAAGLAAAHERGIVHRDLKPENLFLATAGHLKILDFGLARQAGMAASEGATATRPTEPGTVLGTVGYMAPEQVRGERADHRADIFALGAVLYEMLSGRRAFTGPSVVETMNAILHEEPAALLSVGREVPAGLEQIVERCLRKRPEDRFESCRELRIALEALASGQAPSPALSARPPSIAVLPFANLTAEPGQDYFCDGLAEELIAALARLPGLRVAARSSAFRFKGADLRRVGEELKVDKVLEGSVRKSGSRLRVSVQLVDVREGFQLWSERYERDMEDVFAVQDEIATRVVETLQPALAADPRAWGRARTGDLAAYHLYLRGRHSWNKRHQGGLRTAVQYFQEALDRDPGYAAAYAGLADTYALLGLDVFGVLPPHEAMPRAKAAAERALELDAGLAAAYAARAWARFHYDWDWAGAEKDFRTSLAKDPGRATTRHWYSFLLSARGRHDEAATEARRAWEQDPLSATINSNLLQPPYYARRFAEAVEIGQKLVQVEPDFGVHHYWLGLALAALGRHEEAALSHQKHAQLTGRAAQGHVANAWARAGLRDKARQARDELVARRTERYVSAVQLALVCLGLDEKDEALDWLERACDERCDQLPYLDVDTLYDPLRGEPRFEALRRHVGLAQ